MKLVQLICYFTVILPQLQGQTTFSHRYHFDFPDAIITSVLPTDSCYYLTGVASDTVSPFNVISIFAKVDLEGVVEFQKTLRSPTKTYETWRGNLVESHDGNLVVAGYSLDTAMKAILIKYDLDGDTILTKEFLSYFYPEEPFINPQDFFYAPDSGFVFANYVRNPVGQLNAEISILKLNKNGEKEWHKPFGSDLIDRPAAVIADGSGFIIGAWRWNRNLTTQYYTAQNYIFKIDSLGNQEWEYLSPTGQFPTNQLLYHATDMVKTDDGGLVIATGKGTEIFLASVNYIYFETYIYKLNANKQVAWEVTFENQVGSENTILRKLISASDGSGFVATGNLIALPEDGGGMVGTIVKVSPDGEQLWSRLYRYTDYPAAEHWLYDLRETPDEGFIMSGFASDPTLSTQRRQGWLLKVDKHGCLVPDCHLTNSVAEKAQSFQITTYPNPTDDVLNIHFRTQQSQGGTFRIFNLAGIEMQRFAVPAQEMTHLVSVQTYPAGLYYLQYLDDRGVVQWIEEFVVGR